MDLWDLVQSDQERGGTKEVPSTRFTKDPAVKGTNLAENPSLYIAPGTTMMEANPPFSLNTRGAVFPQAPTLAYILSRSSTGTAPHEAQHVQQNMAPDFDRRHVKGMGPHWTKLHDFQQKFNNDPKYKKNFNGNTFSSYRELLATLAGTEATMPAGTSIKDHAFWGNNLPPEIMHYANTYMHPQYNKALDPSKFEARPIEGDPLEPDLGFVKQFQRWVRNKTK